MTLQVIGAGFGRTGTLSLKTALEILGYSKCYHMVELLQHPEQVSYWEAANAGQAVDWDALFEGYQASVDFPGYRHYETLMQTYPDAKVILTVRDPEAWYASTLSTIYKAAPSPLEKLKMLFQLPFSPRLRQIIRVFRMADGVWQKDFQGRFEDQAFALEQFHQHNEAVKRTVPPEKLLVFDVREGWEPLCRFLEKPIPDQPFPRLNDRASFGQMKQQLLKSKAA